MDRKAWIAIILSVIGLIAWQWYLVKNYSLPEKAPTAQATPAANPAPSDTPGIAAASASATPAPTPDGPVMVASSESLSTKDANYVFSNDKGGIERVDLNQHFGEKGKPVSLNVGSSMPVGAMGETPDKPWGNFAMQANPTANEVVFTRQDPDGLLITKTFRVVPGDAKKKDNFIVRMDVEFKNTGAAEVSRLGYFVSTGGAAPVHSRDLPMYTRFDWMHGAEKFTKIDVNWFNASKVPLLGIQWSPEKTLYNEVRSDITWAAVTSQYFCTIVTAEKNKAASVWATRYDTRRQNDAPVYGIQGGLGMPAFKLAPGQSAVESFLIYAGPKELSRLEAMKEHQAAVMDFGMFGIISKFLLWAMNSLNGIFHSYAIAIIVLTLLIKSFLWPIQNKATNQMRKMALLSPKMTEVREKYKDDPQKMNEKMMELYKEYGVNPFSGCLPMLIQIPIFFGFYTMLGSAIELRNSQFFWIHDLSQPDTVGFIPGLNFPINLLPLIMAGTMVWQMAISPKTGDAMQQRIFYFMPIIFLVFCYNYASGLALYWTTQNLFSIVQLYLTRNKPLPTLEKTSVVAKRQADAARKKKKRNGP